MILPAPDPATFSAVQSVASARTERDIAEGRPVDLPYLAVLESHAQQSAHDAAAAGQLIPNQLTGDVPQPPQFDLMGYVQRISGDAEGTRDVIEGQEVVEKARKAFEMAEAQGDPRGMAAALVTLHRTWQEQERRRARAEQVILRYQTTRAKLDALHAAQEARRPGKSGGKLTFDFTGNTLTTVPRAAPEAAGGMVSAPAPRGGTTIDSPSRTYPEKGGT